MSEDELIKYQDIEYWINEAIESLEKAMKEAEGFDNLKKYITGIKEEIEEMKFFVIGEEGRIEDELAHQGFLERQEDIAHMNNEWR